MADGAPLVLASGSAFRRKMLADAGLAFDVVPAAIDERALEAEMTREGHATDASTIAATLALAKARAVSRDRPRALVIGCDQVLGLDGDCLAKAPDTAAARRQLLRLRGRTHALHTAVCLVRAGVCLWETVTVPLLTMRAFSVDFLDRYVDTMGDRLVQTVGAYEIEGRGIQLFERIEGDMFSIIGLPLLPLLAELRRLGVVAA